MSIDVTRITLNRIVLHFVPAGPNDSQNTLRLSETECDLDDEAMRFLRTRMIETLVNRGQVVEFDLRTTSVVPELVLNIMTPGHRNFVADSQTMARHLQGLQNKSNTPGILAIAEVGVGAYGGVVIAKLEHEEGTRAVPTENQDGATFVVQYMQDLLLAGGRGRVFKAALFSQHGTDPSNIEGIVSDNQSARGVANFFLHQFLGCQPKVDPGMNTRNFHEVTETWINSEVEDPDARLDYEMALITELKSNAKEIDPDSFAMRYLRGEDRQSFTNHIANSNVPMATFTKDVDSIQGKLKNISVNFESGIKVIGPPDAIDEKMFKDTALDGQLRVTITDRLVGAKSRG